MRYICLKDVPAFIGPDMIEYGPWKEFNEIEIPNKVAFLLLERKMIGILEETEEDKKKNIINWQSIDRDIIIKDFAENVKKGFDFSRYIELFVKDKGVYYDKNKMWWLWDSEEYCWKNVDEIDLLISLDTAIGFTGSLQQNIKGVILEGLKREGRKQKPKELPKNCLQFKDTIINYLTGENFPASKEYFAVNPIPWKLGNSELTPTIDKLFEDWTNEEKKQMLYEITAYVFSPNYFLHRIFCFIGSGSNGKTTYFSFLKKLIGSHNICSSSLESLLGSRFEGLKLYKKTLCLMGETNFTVLSKTDLLKRLSGQDLISFEKKGLDPFDDVNYAKLFIATNTLPPTTDKTIGFYRRWRIIDFPHCFEEKSDILSTIPEEEFENLCLKCVGLLKKIYLENKITGEEEIDKRKERYEEKSNPIMNFIKEFYETDINSQTLFQIFFSEYLEFLTKKGYREPSKREVSRILSNVGYETSHENIKEGDKYLKKVVILGLKKKDVIYFE